MPQFRREMFVWIPPDRTNESWNCTINGIEVNDFILNGTFSHGLISEELVCEIELDNSGEDFTNLFTYRNEIIFKMDFTEGTIIQFKGEIEELNNKLEGGSYKIKIKGGHYTSQLLDVMVTEEFTDGTLSNIRKALIDEYLTGFTYNNIETNNTTATIKFVNKPLLDCLIQLDILGDEDTYIDFDKDFHTFKKNSKNNDDEALTEDDTMFELTGLSSDSADVRNKIQVIGEAGELPVIYTSTDSFSQTTYRAKEKIITDTSIIGEDQAQEIGDAEKNSLKNPPTTGSAICYFMPKLVPGYLTYVISNPHKIHARYRPVKFTFKVPFKKTEIFFNEEKSVSKLFKDRIKKDMEQETNINPHKMTHSFNFGSATGFLTNKVDFSASNAVEIIEGNLKLIAGNESGNMISIIKNTPIIVNSVHLLIKGENINNITYYINADGTNNWQSVSLNALETAIIKGTKLRLRIKLTDATTRISSIVLLYKA